MPGPIVEVTCADLTYLPLAAAGLARSTASMNARVLASSCSTLNDFLPTRPWMIPAFSTRNSTLPPLTSPTALPTSKVTEPALGFGIRPRGPSTRPSLPTERIMSGVATTASKSIQPPTIFSTSSSPPT